MSAPTREPLPPEPRAPDDASELDADRREATGAAWLEERRRELWSGPRYVYTVALLLVMLATVGYAVYTHFIASDGPAKPPARAPLRSAQAELTGQSGGLLPDVELTSPAGPLGARLFLRAAVLMVVGPVCDCAERMGQVAAQTARHQVQLYLVGSGPQVTELAKGARADQSVTPLRDDDQVFMRTYLGEARFTLVMVRPDGTVSDIIGGDATDLQLDPPILRMLEPVKS